MKIGKYQLSEIRKAVAAFLIGLAGFLAVSLPLLTDGLITVADIVATLGSLAAWIGGTGAVFQLSNEEE